MAGCASCGGCCAPCGSTCGAIGGPAIGAYAESGGSWYSYFSSNPPLLGGDDDTSPVDGDALVNPDHPGHREAIKSISHVDDEKHEKFLQWLREEFHRTEHGGEPQK